MPSTETRRKLQVGQVHLSGWRATLFVVVAGVITVTLFMLFGILFLVAFPVILVAGYALRYLVADDPIRAETERTVAPGRVVEGSYEVTNDGGTTGPVTTEPVHEAIAREQAERADQVVGPEDRLATTDPAEPPNRVGPTDRVERP